MPSATAGVLVAAVQVDALTVAGTVMVDVDAAAPPGAAPSNSQAPMSAQARTGAAMRTADLHVYPSDSGRTVALP